MKSAIATPPNRMAQPLEAVNNPAALLEMRTVQIITGLRATTIYDKMAKGTFPASIRLGARCTRWRAGDITKWLESLK